MSFLANGPVSGADYEDYEDDSDPMNLIALLQSGEITIDGAQRIFEENLQRIHDGASENDWQVEFELSNYEATAYLHGATLEDLRKLRYEGWPASCSKCGLPLDHRVYGWWFVHSEDGVLRLRHIECPNRTLRCGS